MGDNTTTETAPHSASPPPTFTEMDTDAFTSPAFAAARIPSLPSSFYYIPEYITPSEETSILSKIPPSRYITLSHRRLQAFPSTLQISKPPLSTTNPPPTPPQPFLLSAPLPHYLMNPILPRLQTLGIFASTPHRAPNHCLVNEYRPGEGIMPHEDGAAYAAVVATVSLGGCSVLDVYEKDAGGEDRGAGERTEEDGGGREEGDGQDGDAPPPPRWRIFQEPRSLLVTRGAAYHSLLHGIAPLSADEDLRAETVVNWGLLGDAGAVERAGGRSERGVRVSLTYRDVLRVSRVGARVLGVGRR